MPTKDLFFNTAAKKIFTNTFVDYFYSGNVPVFNFTGLAVSKNAEFDSGTVIISTLDPVDSSLGAVAYLDLSSGDYATISGAFSTESQSNITLGPAEATYRRKVIT
jgi:hypothetical protein